MHSVMVRLRHADLLRAQLHLLVHMRIFKILFVMVLLTMAYRMPDSLRETPAIGALALILTAVLLTALGMALGFLLLAVMQVVRLRRDPAALDAREYTITVSGLRVRSNAVDHRLPWDQVRKLIRRRGVLFVGIPHRGLHIIPRRCFASGAAYDEFWNALQPLVVKTEK